MRRELGVAASLFIGAVSACGGPHSPLSGTSWTSTANPSQPADNVTSLVYVMQFGTATSMDSSTATGPFTATLTVVHGASGNRAGCHDATTLSGGTYVDSFVDNSGSSLCISSDCGPSINITGATVSTVSTMCSDPTLNVTSTASDAANGLPNNGGSDAYTIMGTTMTFSIADSAVPYDGAWTFMKM